MSRILATLPLSLLSWLTLATEVAAAPQEPVVTAEGRLASWERHRSLLEESGFADLRWRRAGPRFQGGRIESIAVPVDAPYTIYLGVGAGGVWKTTNHGMTWKPIFEHEATFAIGDVAVSRTNPAIVWVGTGEAHLSGTSFSGCGVYRSDDGGSTWRNTGLHDSYHIGQVVVDPEDPDLVHVAAIGHMRSANEERGVFRTTDGGKTWTKVLYAGDHVGAIDLVQDPTEPTRLYASTWQRGGGEGSGVFRSEDRGESWTRVEGGFPTGGDVGRIALDASASAPGVVYALVVDHSPPGRGRYDVGGMVLRSDDAGVTWRRTSEEYVPTYVGWDFCDVKVSPDDADVVYVCGFKLLRSRDGGATFQRVEENVHRLMPLRGTALHLDMHDLWIDPENPERLLLGNDGGLFVTWDRGGTWLHLNNLPIAEFYTVAVDDGDPYRIFGGTQDNASLWAPATASTEAFSEDPWQQVFLDPWCGGDGFVTLPDPTDPDVVYYETQLGEMRRKRLSGPIQVGSEGDVSIRPRPAEGEPPLRFAWNTPFLVSRHDPRTLYCAAERVFRSTNRGDEWTCISPDLTVREAGATGRGAILTLSESPLERGLLYAASGGGLVQVTADDGGSWKVVGEGVPALSPTRVVASAHDADTVYLTLTGRDHDDFQAYVFRSDDRGKSWKPITANLPAEPVNVVAEDPRHAEILYLGTDLGVYASLDRGESWVSLCGDLPTAAVVDLVAHPREPDLVAATHGLGVFVLDVTPGRERLGER